MRPSARLRPIGARCDRCSADFRQGKGIPYPRMAWLPPRRRPLLVNFFRNFEAICRKDHQVETLRSYARANGLGEEELCPLSFAFWPADGKRR